MKGANSILLTILLALAVMFGPSRSRHAPQRTKVAFDESAPFLALYCEEPLRLRRWLEIAVWSDGTTIVGVQRESGSTDYQFHELATDQIAVLRELLSTLTISTPTDLYLSGPHVPKRRYIYFADPESGAHIEWVRDHLPIHSRWAPHMGDADRASAFEADRIRLTDTAERFAFAAACGSGASKPPLALNDWTNL